MADKVPRSVWRNPVHFLAFGLGSGTVDKAPGTFGTLAAIPIYLLMQHWTDLNYLIMLIVTFIVGIYLCDKTSKDLGVHDHSGIVWDEFVGFWITMWMAPEGWLYIIVGFVLFRVFDILKPWPISWLDKKVEGGFGIMIDDVLAGVFALLALQGLIHLGI
ncbi:phosphatidylglycerophosphatase A [Marinomonas sp. 15G1-11]|uniref:Phosphatidylglycerophosphatase A n=1 Tax=Marinomonas phaeophyticola TaxID=3004091 RepID=A0ABT4JYS8_9GAMM|nr:phosphatidylglycerophosphatase A [Marinomonas sp. 15G1-11]MCZ2723545.1 phosphatidylglycerophosphatase A [Marinomonas sp. 15G1-11]